MGEIADRMQTAPPMVVLRPGDRVLVVLDGDPPADECQHITGELCRAFPAVDFTVLGGVASVCVQGGGESWPEPDTEPPTAG